MTRHNEILNKFKSILSVFDFSIKDHRDVVSKTTTERETSGKWRVQLPHLGMACLCWLSVGFNLKYEATDWTNIVCPSDLLFVLQLMMIMIKVSDISNEARPMEVAEPWLDCLLQEFYNQVLHKASRKNCASVNN